MQRLHTGGASTCDAARTTAGTTLALCAVERPSVSPEAQAQAAPAETRVVYRVEGMTCGGCASHVKTALEKIPGVTSASVSYEASEATVLWSTTPDDSKVVAALKELGYRAARAAGRSGETRATGL